MSVALKCPYYKGVRFEYGKRKKKKTYALAPELITIMLRVTKPKKEKIAT